MRNRKCLMLDPLNNFCYYSFKIFRPRRITPSSISIILHKIRKPNSLTVKSADLLRCDVSICWIQNPILVFGFRFKNSIVQNAAPLQYLIKKMRYD